MTRILAAALIVLCSATAASATVTVVPGWPRAALSGRVLPGPGGGIVVASSDSSRATVSAYRRDGRRLWASARTPSCGNCDDGPQPERLQPDGTYGPIGVEGDDFWAVDARGRILVPGCAGAVTADGSCLTGYALPFSSLRGSPGILGRPAGAPQWTVSDERFSWESEFNVPPMSVSDGADIVYTAFPLPTERATGVRLTGVLIAVDPVARAILWTRAGPAEALTGLTSGVLIDDGAGGIAAIGAGGAPRWSRPLPAGHRATPAGTALDGARGRVYVSLAAGATQARVLALDAATGAAAWSTAPGDRARLLSVGRGGRVYVAVDRPGRLAVRALRVRDGATAWQRRTSLPVRGALELANGTVAVSAGQRFAPMRTDRLTLLDPRG